MSSRLEQRLGAALGPLARRAPIHRVLSGVGRRVPGAAGGFLRQLGRYAGSSSFSRAELVDELTPLLPSAGEGPKGGPIATLHRNNQRLAAWVASHSYDAFATALQRMAVFHAFRGLEHSSHAHRQIDFRLIVDWYSAFRQVSVTRVLWDVDLVQDKARSLRLWQQATADETEVSAESLSRYYNSIPFPGTCGLLRIWNAPWLVSRVFPLLVARQTSASPSFFDYGGSTGLLTSIARSMGYGPVALIDDYEAGLQFARFRDALLGRAGIDYLRPENVQVYAQRQRFDVGCCHQVLEHLSDMRPCLEQLSRLLRRGGLLFLSTGFGLYPHPGHLRANVQYAGREAELLAPFGFEPVTLDLAPFGLERFLYVFEKTRD